MKFRIALFLIMSTCVVISCQTTNQKSPLDIDINQVESVNIYNIYGHFKEYGLVERDTIIPIDKKDWQPLIDNFNIAEPLDSQKSTVYYSIIVNTKNEDKITIQVTSGDSFRVENGKTYAFEKASIDILNQYYTEVPFMK
ncbi:MAG: hypothetical protein AB8G11_13475 [Saprospiraceae bacterium]